MNSEEMIKELMKCDKCEADLSGVSPCYEDEQKFQEEVEYLMSDKDNTSTEGDTN